MRIAPRARDSLLFEPLESFSSTVSSEASIGSGGGVVASVYPIYDVIMRSKYIALIFYLSVI